ncbi:MAG: hypothetical protein NTY65_00440 [Planctomycetota bacterium]|nr:hypothetical protein [Planctomycetota bacterium]
MADWRGTILLAVSAWAALAGCSHEPDKALSWTVRLTLDAGVIEVDDYGTLLTGDGKRMVRSGSAPVEAEYRDIIQGDVDKVAHEVKPGVYYSEHDRAVECRVDVIRDGSTFTYEVTSSRSAGPDAPKPLVHLVNVVVGLTKY